jgi:hypothetical protein
VERRRCEVRDQRPISIHSRENQEGTSEGLGVGSAPQLSEERPGSPRRSRSVLALGSDRVVVQANLKRLDCSALYTVPSDRVSLAPSRNPLRSGRCRR